MNDAKRIVTVMETGDGSKELRELFLLTDVDESGSVSNEEWASGVADNAELCGKLFGANRSKESLLRVFQRLLPPHCADTGMTWEQFEVGVGSLRVSLAMGVAMSTEEGEQMLKQLFDTLDKDNSGSVDVSEWSRGVEENRVKVAKLFGVATQAEIATAFARIDTDGDGMLTWAEFVSGAARFTAAPPPAPADAAAE